MKKKSFKSVKGLLFVLLGIPTSIFSQHVHPTKGLAFTNFDFQIIENFIHLKTDPSDDKCPSLYYNHSKSELQFHYFSNCDEWEAIRIMDNADTPVDYYLNYQIKETELSDKTHITIVTSHGGELTNRKAIHHFLTIIDEIKLALLVPEYFNSLFRYLLTHGKEGDVFLFQGNMLSIHVLGPSLRRIEVTPASSDYFPYRIEQRLTRRKSKIRWQYLVPLEENLSDDFFFKHYSDLLLAAKAHNDLLSGDAPLVER